MRCRGVPPEPHKGDKGLRSDGGRGAKADSARAPVVQENSNMVDIYEEMLYARAVKGIRPVLYVSSNKDFEHSVLKLLDEPREARMWEQHQHVLPRVRHHVTTN